MSLFEIVTANEDRTLISQDEAREAVGDSSADVTDLILRVSAALTRACNVRAAGVTPPTLRSEAVRDTFRLKARNETLILSRRPAHTITSVVENGTTLTAGTDFENHAEAGLLKRLSGDCETCWPACKIVVSYTAGWETVPDDLKLAAMKLTAVFYTEGQRVDPSLKRENIPGVREVEYWVSPTDDHALPQEVIDLIASYRNIVVG